MKRFTFKKLKIFKKKTENLKEKLNKNEMKLMS